MDGGEKGGGGLGAIRKSALGLTALSIAAKLKGGTGVYTGRKEAWVLSFLSPPLYYCSFLFVSLDTRDANTDGGGKGGEGGTFLASIALGVFPAGLYPLFLFLLFFRPSSSNTT